VTISAGATLTSAYSGTGDFLRSTTSANALGTITVAGILKFSSTNAPTLPAITYNFSGGTIEYSGGTQPLLAKSITAASATDPNAVPYNHITLSGTGTNTLSGNITVNGTLTVNPGATLDFNGLNVTAAAPPTLNGSLTMEVTKTGATFTGSKLTQTSGTLACGGGLTLTASGAALAGADVVDLFDAASFVGAFSTTNVPSLDVGLNWWYGRLLSDGQLVINRAPTVSDKSYIRAAGASLLILKSALMSDASDPDVGDSASYDTLISTGSQGATVTTNATAILYEPANNTNDTLTFRVKDTRGGTVTRNITITVDNSSAGGTAQNITPAGGGMAVTFAGIPTLKYDVERADNVSFTVNLTTVTTTNAPAHGIFTIIDNDPPQPSAYYRLKFNPN